LEQSSGVTQVGQTIAQIDQATQRNAALVEQSSAAAESLKRQAHQLVQAVAVFNLGQGDPQREPATATTDPAADRRSQRRATNVTRLRPNDGAKPAAARLARSKDGRPMPTKTGTNDWKSF
jgi:pyruvate/2-oxoglutarate dehydrogenase complex dihydrolipoamide acyltransferase (E2) component